MSNDSFIDDPFSSDPELAAIAREFRETMRQEQIELEEMSSEFHEASMDMSFAFLELMWSGARIRVLMGEKFFEGNIVHVGKDFVQINAGPGITVDVHNAFITSVFILDRNINQGRPIVKKEPKTFVARLRELAAFPMQHVEIGSDSSTLNVNGILKMVRSDHIVVANRDKKEWLIPTGNIGYCLTRAQAR